MYKLTCSYCKTVLVQPSSGRPRQTCSDPACQRQADTDRKRSLRRKQAGIDGWLYTAPQSRGGRDPLIRRIAKRLATAIARHVQPTAEEWAAIETAVRLDWSPYSLNVTHSGVVRGLPAGMGQAERQVLRGFVLRNREATPERPPRPVASVDVVGQLPEPFTRRPGARKTGQSPGWIDLPLPDKKRLIEL